MQPSYSPAFEACQEAIFQSSPCLTHTVVARPVIVTRSPTTSTPTDPDLGDTWSPTSDERPRRSAQNGPSTVCELPVTGSSGIPTLGRSEIWNQVAHGALVRENGQQEEGVMCLTGPFDGHTECCRRRAPSLSLGRRPGWKVHRQ